MNPSLEYSMIQSVAHDGEPANVVTLCNEQGLSITLMDIGATWLSCQLSIDETETRELLLGVSSIEDFYKQECYLGVTVGRYANRIAKGQFVIDGKQYQVSTNQAGNCLHGGEVGFDKRRWKIAEQTNDKVIFALRSEHGDQGFPGNLDVSVTYQLLADNSVLIDYHANTDSATPVNLTNHAYFNLGNGEDDCKQHRLLINAEQYLPTSEMGIPLDKPIDVVDTGFDFRLMKSISKDFLSDEQQVLARGYDHSFVLKPDCLAGEKAAEAISPDNKVKLSVFTDKPAMQLYTGNWLAGNPNRKGERYQNHAGFALETQFLPDSMNHLEWNQPSCILQPGEQYHFSTRYQFELIG
ncbi:galactose-1-epimerase [Vibrio marisflavi]|uniref:Aldose 1-epimerase n=1 Tax=Vibrio marisflavi CECT 7928 TaxID=634439 RepID=A0ABM9A765_9VIBR|nr:galactose-1-epimerase [Vibrio marisflavi]CAH0541169.1 Aldose 1-epimerase [Vibrio marisflavi CECT 7928]